MVAPTKLQTKTRDEQKKIAKEIFKQVMDNLKGQNGNVKSCELEVYTCGHGERPFGTHGNGAYIDLSVEFNRQKWSGLGTSDCESIAKEFKALFNEQKKKRGYGSLILTEGEVYIGWGNFDPDFLFPHEVLLFAQPCKEFVTLQKLLTKHCGKTITLNDLYQVGLFGKSGRYGESGGKHYICYNATKCNELVQFIRTNKTSKDTLSFELLDNDNIDTDYSERYLTECYGNRERVIKLSVTTAKGKVKATR